MFGIGIQQMIILAVILGMMIVPAGIVLTVIYFVMRSQKQTSAQPNNLIRCPDCNWEVSRYAQTCPKCGRPTATQG